MIRTCVDALIESISSLQDQVWMPNEEIQRLKHFEVELRFIKMLIWCSVSSDFDANLASIFNSIESIWECIWEHDQVSKKLRSPPSNREIKKSFDQLDKKILLSQQKIKKYCEHLISKSLTCKSLTSHEIKQFLDAMIIDMDRIVSFVADEFLPVKNLIASIKDKLVIFRNLVEFTSMRCADDGNAVEGFNIHVLSWAKKAACLTFLYCEAVQDEGCSCGILTFGLLGKSESEKNNLYILVTDLMHNVNPCTLEFIDMCFSVTKLIKLSSSDIFLFEDFVSDFVDFLLQNLMLTSKDDFQILREGLIYLITFIASLPVDYTENYELILFQNQIDAVLIEISHIICQFGRDKITFTSADTVLGKLVEMIDQVKRKIDKHIVQLPHSSWSYVPKPNGLGFVESLLVYLNDLEESMSDHPKLVPSLKDQIFTIKDELTSLRPFVEQLSNLENEGKELKDLRKEIICVAYQAELAIKQSFFVDRPLCISFVLVKLQAIRSKVMRVEKSKIYTTRVISSLTSSANMSTVSLPTSRVVEEVVGFKEETNELIDRLIAGAKELAIVSIVGMGGIGKTTLAKKLYNEVSVTLSFHKKAFCTISQGYRKKYILLNILTQVIGNDVDLSDMSDEDLDLRLYQSLKGFKYLIVLDDIWDMNAWNDVKDSFPENRSGSRVMFTTRVNDLAFLANPNCSTHRLPFLTIDESWDLLQRKIFHKNACPSNLCEVGMSIAENCKGLPLAIVVIAGVLVKSKNSLSWWKEVANNVISYVSGDRLSDLLELSYKHLSEATKPCLLYLGAFPEDTIFKVRDIAKLWAAEGFALKSDGMRVDKVAKECLNYLGERSLLLVAERSLAGNVKHFGLHDLIREFCIRKAQEEQLLCLVNGDDDNLSKPFIYDQYRICVQAECVSYLDTNPRGPAVHSLLCSQDGYDTYRRVTSSLFSNFRAIQVLDLRPIQFLDFPIGITMLVHLKYLAFGYVCSLGYVPPTIANLLYLESLLIEAEAIVYLPDTIWEMKRLRHLEIPFGCRFFGLEDVESETFTELPNLERLGDVVITSKEEGEKLFRRLPNIRKLELTCGELVPEQLVNLSKLESLTIACYDCESSLNLPSTLKKLSLQQFRLPCEALSTRIGLNSLPCLQVLKLNYCQFDGKRWDTDDDEFPNLKRLELWFSGIEHWNATTDSFPCLERLVLHRCDELVKIPPCFGEIQTLKTLQVHHCSESVRTSAIQIQEEQIDLGNDSLEFLILK